MRTLEPELTEEKNKLSQTEPWLLLWQIDADAAGTTKYCFVAHEEEVEFDGVTYSPFPIAPEERTENTEGNQTSWPVKVAYVTRAFKTELKATNGFKGHAVKVILVHKDHLDNPEAKIEDTYRVHSYSATEKEVTFQLGHTNLLEVMFLSERFTDRCRWVYQSRECGYAGALGSCDKTLDGTAGCVAHATDSSIHPQRFGGYPVIPEA